MDVELFNADVWDPALEQYAGVTQLTVALFDADGQSVSGPFHPTPLFDLLAQSAYGGGFFDECLRRCLQRARSRPDVVLVDRFGFAGIGVPLILNGETKGAAVAGFHLLEFAQPIAVERLAREASLRAPQLWDVVRRERPISKPQFVAQGKLLRAFGEALLVQQHRMRQHVELSARLQAADAAKDEFLALVSHELRGPLNAILGWARLARTEPLKDAARERALETIERNARVQVQLVEQLLDVSRIVAGKLHIDRQLVTLKPIVEAAIESVAPAADSKGIRIESQLQDVSEPVAGDPVQLQQVISNVLVNAVKFTPPDGKVSVRLSRNISEAEIQVADTGDGIAPEFLPHIFEPFRQQDASTTRVHGGIGLGLTIVRHLVALHGGSVRAESAGVGQGATFTISLPLNVASSPEASTSDRRSVSTTASVEALPQSLRQLHVLVVEDNQDARDLLQMLLEGAGAEVTAVSSAADALAALERTRPDVLVSDIGLPGQDGYALIREVRRRGRGRSGDIPAVAVTAWASTADRERATLAGYQLHLAKPVDAAQLIQAVASLAKSNTRTFARRARGDQ